MSKGLGGPRPLQAVAGCIAEMGKLGFPFKCQDPFLFCVYHKDKFPPSTGKLRKGNGADFDWSQDYRMYHGEDLSGFPQHPHRGFETVTATIQGFVDHTDSMGNAGRYGQGDLQWMTAGAGVVHGEMFPLVHSDKPNETKFFQIWLNLPRANKMAPPMYTMHWFEQIPKVVSLDGLAELTLWAGKHDGKEGLPPPPHSYGSNSSSDLAIWFLKLLPGGSFTIPPAQNGLQTNRNLYWTEGDLLNVGDQSVSEHCVMTLLADQSALIHNPSPTVTSELLMLQGKPIGEPVVQHGPFVMNSAAEIEQAFRDYRATQFGGWPWPEDAMSFPATKGRFTLQNGKEEQPPTQS